MYDKMTADYLLIGELNERHEDMVLDTYIDLLSGKNGVFNNVVQRGNNEWELGKDQNFEDMMKSATIKYKNMINKSFGCRWIRRMQKS